MTEPELQTASASSVYSETNSESNYGPEQAIDGIRKEGFNFWHSAENRYDALTGEYLGGEQGEWLQLKYNKPV